MMLGFGLEAKFFGLGLAATLPLACKAVALAKFQEFSAMHLLILCTI